jgi:hypothetical protein
MVKGSTMPTDLELHDLAERGEAYYQQHLRQAVEQQHHGMFLVLDVESGAYEIDTTDIAATKRLLARVPNAFTYGVRIGYATAYRLGGRRLSLHT